jgi:hypothetical protein
MTEKFREEIKKHPQQLYYNSTGSGIAYKLAIAHLSFAVQQKVAFMGGEFFYPKEPLYLVDLEREVIEIITEKIELIKIKQLK